jgi:integrase
MGEGPLTSVLARVTDPGYFLLFRMTRGKALNKSFVKSVRAPTASGNQEIHWCRDTKGFGLLVSGVSTQKTFVAQTKLKSGKRRRVTIGKAYEMSVDKAREKAIVQLQLMRTGVDPKAKGATTLAQALDEYLAANTDLRASSVRGYRSSIDRYLEEWKGLALDQITVTMVQERHREIAREIAATNGGNKGHATTNGVMRCLRAIYNFKAEAQPELINPVKLRKKWFDVRKRERMVKPNQARPFYHAVLALSNPIAQDYLFLVMFTGLRRREATALSWDEVDLTAKTITIPAERTKARRPLVLPISDFVEELLLRRSAAGMMKFVFPSSAGSRSGHVEEPRVWFKMIEQNTGIKVSPHDLRRTFTTATEHAQIMPRIQSALVNHSLGRDVTSRYVIIPVSELIEPMQKVTNKLKEWIGIK